jgi:ABC-type dipeptide/oligopeptide/nickel transport system ATPase subunit
MSATTEDRSLGVPHVSGALRDGEAEIELRGVSKRFSARNRETVALTDIDLGIRKQEFVTLLGQSGCGKTTLLRILAGLTQPSDGEVTISGRPLWRGDHRDDEALRKLGLVFQAASARAGRPRRTAGLREGAAARALGRHAPARRHRPGPELQP